jgi:murein DD-endopeptidase MepM/ murein hydrolase activator NlpD
MAFESIVAGGGVLTQDFGNTAWARANQAEWNCPSLGSSGYSYHAGIDIATGRCGATLLAVGYGQVVYVGRGGGKCGGLGPNAVCIRSGNIEVWYGHASRALVVKDQLVVPGQPVSILGSVGCSNGCHIHYEVMPAGQSYAGNFGCQAISPWQYVQQWPGRAPAPAPTPVPPPSRSAVPAVLAGLAAVALLAYAGGGTSKTNRTPPPAPEGV